MTTDYTMLPSSTTIARLERLRQFIVVDGGKASEDHIMELREALDTVIPLLEDIRSALSEESVAKARAFTAAVEGSRRSAKEATQ